MWRVLLSRSSILAQARGLATKRNAPEPKFTQSAAFQGRGSRGMPQFKPDYYSSDAYANKKVLSAIGSLIAIVIYFGWLREPSDLDEIWSAPPHILTSNLERKMLREQIKQAQEKGMDTALLRAQLEYVDVKEEALRIQFEQKTNQLARRNQQS
ncbi:uncharacterized protein CELE_F10E7.6 [Caenorhabditis elegans]|uniref:Uncharacterized protein n=1 Tax=Caenorhabditis elegans TaxID=6239 RepID=Q19303_CAEEL|nr:Uncharacterized protein CELE_F10E7.6 [Caenorhabditis elegans]CCD69168.1 Uncharacterized protein CELE_F10E7.6 [Caenorhabditis elegans]|eukprot:NP_495471.1 Uncharacterized protein CELE_F10E7.6 [Caenorhabditis elegans]